MVTTININHRFGIGEIVLVKGRQHPFKVVAIVPLDCSGAFQYHLESVSDSYPDVTVSECLILKSLQ